MNDAARASDVSRRETAPELVAEPSRLLTLSDGTVVEPAILASVVESPMDAILALDDDQRIVLFNPGAEAMFGCTAAEAMGSPLDRFLPLRFRESHRRLIRQFGETGSTSRGMGHLRPLAAIRADGDEFPIEATISQVVVDDQRYYAAIVRDISQRRRAEEERERVIAQEALARAETLAMADQRDRLHEILDRLPSGVYIVSAADGMLEFANAAFMELTLLLDTGSDALPVYGRDFLYLRADGMSLQTGERPAARVGRGERVANQQLILERRDGSRIAVTAYAAALDVEHGQTGSVIVMVQDVTQLRQAEQLKDDFLALISHEFRTPLTAIHGGAHMLARAGTSLDDETRNELLEDVVTESERLDRMLGNILTLANIMAGRLPVDTEPVLLSPLATRVATQVTPPDARHRFVIDIASGIPPVEADPGLLDQVLRNLYENAIKYAPDGGEIRTDARVSDGQVAIRVVDQGIGIAPEHVSSVFERFRRVGSDPTVRGMGLGLYLSRHLVEAQHGTIAASSDGPGRGTVFTVTLPIAAGWPGDAGGAPDAGGGSR